MFKKLLLSSVLVFASVSINADTILFTISGGPICDLQGPCDTQDDVFYDVTTTTFTGDVQADGSILVTDSIELSFDGGSQSIIMTVFNQVLTADVFNFPPVPGVLPNGNWTGMFEFVASNGDQGLIDLAPNSGQTFFIDNEESAFNFALIGSGDNAAINFFVTGNAELIAAPVPLPAGLWLLLSGVSLMVGVRKRI